MLAAVLDSLFSKFIERDMAKGIFKAIVILCALVAADETFNYGRLTDGALSMLHQIARSFGF